MPGTVCTIDFNNWYVFLYGTKLNKELIALYVPSPSLTIVAEPTGIENNSSAHLKKYVSQSMYIIGKFSSILYIAIFEAVFDNLLSSIPR